LKRRGEKKCKKKKKKKKKKTQTTRSFSFASLSPLLLPFSVPFRDLFEAQRR